MSDITWEITFIDAHGESSTYYNAPTKELAIRLFSLEYYNATFLTIH
jgi:hypothetical protein